MTDDYNPDNNPYNPDKNPGYYGDNNPATYNFDPDDHNDYPAYPDYGDPTFLDSPRPRPEAATAATSIVMDEGLLPDTGTDVLLGFVDPLRYGAAYNLADWNVEEEIDELVKLARQDHNLRIKLAAIARLRKNAIDTLLLSGRLRRLTAHTNEGGRTTLTIQAVGQAVGAARHGLRRSAACLPSAATRQQPSLPIIEAEPTGQRPEQEIPNASEHSNPPNLENPETPEADNPAYAVQIHKPPVEYDLPGPGSPGSSSAAGSAGVAGVSEGVGAGGSPGEGRLGEAGLPTGDEACDVARRALARSAYPGERPQEQPTPLLYGVELPNNLQGGGGSHARGGPPPLPPLAADGRSPR